MKTCGIKLLVTLYLIVCFTHLSYCSEAAASFTKLFRAVSLEMPLAKKGNKEYLKIDETTPVQVTTHIRAVFQVCKGSVRIWVKQCNPSKVKCDDSSKWFPSSKYYDLTEGRYDSSMQYQTELTKLCTSDYGLCDSH